VSRVQRDSKGQPLSSGAYDLRLFRDGQIVAETLTGESSEQLNEWRQVSRIKLDMTGRALVEFKSIPVPRGGDASQIEFSAYAFNEDRVKSETTKKQFHLEPSPRTVKPRAYLITIGVSRFENPAWNLEFAASDAVIAARTMATTLATSNKYELVPLSLLSDFRTGNQPAAGKLPTKANLKEVIELLSGERQSPALLKNVREAAKLQRATPDDLVFIFLSSHGLYRKIASIERFYFLPFDIGPGSGIEESPSLFAHSISTDELSSWLKKVDAGEIVFIVNACQSEAAVKTHGFKPGPFGNRGLGQLAYDKRMRVLTSSQALGSAIEMGSLSSSVLTRALFVEGLEQRKADFNPKDQEISFSEWLEFAERRVPELCRELNYPESQIQQPVLFEFLTNRKPVTLLRKATLAHQF
jgi:hypothetical protein